MSLLIGAPASAHHSFAKFDRQRSIELEGELIEVRWQNPHVTFELRGRGADGQVQTWQLETNSPGILRRTGVGRVQLRRCAAGAWPIAQLPFR